MHGVMHYSTILDERGKLSHDLRGGNISFFVIGILRILFLD
jgi:hypothetical protein